jgi:hypothetical protein
MKNAIYSLLIAVSVFFLGHTFGSRQVAELKSANRLLIQEQRKELSYDMGMTSDLHQTNSEAAIGVLVMRFDSALQTIIEQQGQISYTTNDLQFFNHVLNFRKTNSWMDNYSFTNWNTGGSNLFNIH